MSTASTTIAVPLPWIRGGIAGLVVSLSGQLASPEAIILALTAGVTFFDLGRREASESANGGDWTGWGMQLGFLAILAAGAFQNREPITQLRWPGLIEITGALLIAGGIFLRQWVSRVMGEHFTVKLLVADEHRLVLEGPFARIRHPSYASLLLIAVGTALAVRSPLALAVALGIWLPLTVLRIANEEVVLEDKFGHAYRDYRAHSWRLLPGIF